jgi:hypothetical protein
MKPDNPLDPLVRQSFGAPLPEEVRHAMRRQMETAQSEWRAQAEKPRSIFDTHPRVSWLTVAASLVILALGGARWARDRTTIAQVAPESSYACAVAHFPEKSATCTAVFYSNADPSLWTERRIVMLDSNGNMTEVIAYNQKRSSI